MLAWPATAGDNRQLPALAQENYVARRKIDRDRELTCGEKVGIYVALPSGHQLYLAGPVGSTQAGTIGGFKTGFIGGLFALGCASWREPCWEIGGFSGEMGSEG
jgi:hypothetical protein